MIIRATLSGLIEMNGKLNSLTTLQVSEDSKLHSYEHIVQPLNREYSRAEHTHREQHEITESYFFVTPSTTREIELDFERYF